MVDEYREKHIPTELQKVKVNQEHLQEAIATVGQNVCAFRTYATELKASNDTIAAHNQLLKNKKDVVVKQYDTLNNQLPGAVQGTLTFK